MMSPARSAAMLLLVALSAGCGSAATDTPAPNSSRSPDVTRNPAAPTQLDDVTGALVITRQRDLIDRGLINVMTQNDAATSLLLSDVELVADTFDSKPAPERTISVRSGGRIAIQVPYGVVDDCDNRRPVEAELTFTYASADDPAERPGRIELDGTDILDSIRAVQCTTRRFDQSARTRFDGTAIVDGTVVTRLVIEPTGTATGLVVGAVSGTILMSVDAPTGWDGVELHDEPVAIPLTFVVNRCDPHAIAEITKRFGLDLDVSVDGAAPVPVSIDIAEVSDDLEVIVEQCQLALPQE